MGHAWVDTEKHTCLSHHMFQGHATYFRDLIWLVGWILPTNSHHLDSNSFHFFTNSEMLNLPQEHTLGASWATVSSVQGTK